MRKKNNWLTQNLLPTILGWSHYSEACKKWKIIKFVACARLSFLHMATKWNLIHSKIWSMINQNVENAETFTNAVRSIEITPDLLWAPHLQRLNNVTHRSNALSPGYRVGLHTARWNVSEKFTKKYWISSNFTSKLNWLVIPIDSQSRIKIVVWSYTCWKMTNPNWIRKKKCEFTSDHMFIS